MAGTTTEEGSLTVCIDAEWCSRQAGSIQDFDSGEAWQAAFERRHWKRPTTAETPQRRATDRPDALELISQTQRNGT